MKTRHFLRTKLNWVQVWVQRMKNERYICQFSCGAASAVATKLILAEQPPENVLIVNAFIAEEHEDNRRFLADCERWFNHPITVLKDEQFGASTREVWRAKRFMKRGRFAPCSHQLKRDLLRKIAKPSDISVLGYTHEEIERLENLQAYFPGEVFRAPLIERGLDKGDCYSIIHKAGIEIPAMYRLGYDNANCIGCVKGGQAYWQNIREDFPQMFAEIQLIQEEIGPGASFLRFRSGPRLEERMSLRDLPPGRGDMAREPSFTCSFFCQAVEDEI